MPVRKNPPRRVGITDVPGRVRIKPPLRPEERVALRKMFAALAQAPLAQELEELGDRIGARMEALGFPPVLGSYEIDDPDGIELGAAGSWRTAPPTDAAVGEPPGDAAPPATARHPALLRHHEGTEPWLLAKALWRLAEVRVYLEGTRRLNAEDLPRALEHLIRASIWLGDHVRHADLKQVVEEPVRRAELAADRHSYGGRLTGGKRHAAAEPRREEWRAEARAIWARRPELTIKRVAELINEGRVRNGAPPAGVSTISQAINHLKPGT